MTISEITLPASLHAALYFAAVYFAAALITGVWKWRAMLGDAEGKAHAYIDIAHHAALHYGPFILLAGALAAFWPFGEMLPGWVLVEIMGWTMVTSLSRYISLGLRGATTNQLKRPSWFAQIGLLFFFLGACIPGLAISFGALVSLWSGLPGTEFLTAAATPIIGR
jgi:hypothetical protein